MNILAQIIGISAVVFYLLSYQCKRRRNIIVVNIISRILYVVQYVLLGAFVGAALDFSGMIASFAAEKKDKFINKRFGKVIPYVMAVLLVAVGLSVYENVFSILAICGILLETTAFWITNETKIRIVSFLAAPFWLVYNIVNQAYGSAIGCVLAMVSIAIAMVRYDLRGKKNG